MPPVPAQLRFRVTIDGEAQLSRRVYGLMERLSDLTPLWTKIVADWKATQAKLFAAEGAFEGQERWAPLSERYARWKARHYSGSTLLIRDGRLYRATTNPEVQMAPTSLTLTIDNAYAIYHQSGRARTSHLPRRAFASLTAGQKRRW